MSRRLRSERFLLGLHGLALLRGWPLGAEADADRTIDAIRDVLRRADAGELPPFEVDTLEVGDAYAQWSETYDAFPNALISAEEPVVRRILEAEAPGLAIDAASGTGRLAGILSDLGHEVVAVDRSAAMLTANAERSAELVVGDLIALPVRDGVVAVATCALAMTHLPALGDAVRELARIVRPGGCVLVSDVHPVAVATGAHAMFRRADGSRGVTRNEVHWPSAYVRAATAAGLVVERCEEVLVDQAFLAEMRDDGVRAAAGGALLGLPVAIVWVFRKPAM